MNYVMYLVIAIVTIIAFSLMYLGQVKLYDYVASVNRIKIDAEINDGNITQSKKIATVLESHAEDVKKAGAVIADTKYYAYQDDIVRDLNSYAKASGIVITGFNFSVPTTTAPAAGGASAAAGPKTVSADIKMVSPLPYKNYLQFLRYIENNRTKMIVSQLEVQSVHTDTNMVEASSITVEIYVR